MEHQHKEQQYGKYEPFEIVHNARKNSKHLKSTAAKSRKNSTISLVDEKVKKIKKKPRKLTDYLQAENQWFQDINEYSQKRVQNEDNIFGHVLFQIEHENINIQQKFKQSKEQFILNDKQQDGFYFHDGDGEKGIMQGIGDEDSLGRQFNFDFFNPEKYGK